MALKKLSIAPMESSRVYMLTEDPEMYLLRLGDNRQVVKPADNELFIDIDSHDAYYEFNQMMDLFQECGVVYTISRDTPSQQEGHRHIVIKLGMPVDPMTRIALQCALGSDRKRELLSALRIVLKTNRPPTVFFEERD